MANGNQRKTFLSYSRTNKDFAIKLAKELKSEGFYIWLDQLDIPAGARWDREVEKALRECEIFMIILTQSSVDSENVLDEIGYAIDSRKRFLPVLLENCDVPLRLRRFQYVDFTNKSFDDGVESAKDLLRSLIAQTTVPRGEIPAQPQDQLAHAEAESKAEEEAERIAKQVADEEVATKAEANRKAKEEADRLATQKAEAERKAKEKAKPVEVKVDPIPVVVTTTQKKSVSRGLMIGIVAVVVLCIAGIGIGLSSLSNRGTPATEAPIISASATKVKPANTPKPPTATPIPVPVVLSVSEASQLSDSVSVKGFYTLSREQYTDDQLAEFTNNNQPFPLTLTDSIPLLLGWSTCAKTLEILEDNMLSIDYTFQFMGKTIPESDHASYDFTSDTGDICRVTYIIIDQWVTGQYSVYQGAEQTETINDGYSDIEPYSQGNEYVITVP